LVLLYPDQLSNTSFNLIIIVREVLEGLPSLSYFIPNGLSHLKIIKRTSRSGQRFSGDHKAGISDASGNLAAIMTGLISLVKPWPFYWEVTCSINAPVINEPTLTASPPESTPNLSDSEKEKERIEELGPANRSLPTMQDERKNSIKILLNRQSYVLTLSSHASRLSPYYHHGLSNSDADVLLALHIQQGFFTARVVISFI